VWVLLVIGISLYSCRFRTRYFTILCFGHRPIFAGPPTGRFVVMRLPPTFTSLYRLFLRTSSAAVQNRSASHNLRRLWRPTFQIASEVVTRLDDPSLPQDQQEELRKWLEIWEHRSAHLLSNFPRFNWSSGEFRCSG
jgi:hypothetical protein